MKKKIIFLVGPTAIGKTRIAVKLAAKINAEIISCDSMQVYKKMDIITSKPSLEEAKRVKHHLIGHVPVSREYNVAAYRRAAVNKAKGILKRNKIPLFVGGTGLYVSILADGIFNIHCCDEAMRGRLYEEANSLGSAHLYGRLKEVDPQAAKKIHANDTRRIVRALEVYAVTGKPISQLQGRRKGLRSEYDAEIFCLDMERVKLYNRIDKRVDEMFAKGLLEEVEGLLKLKLSKTASCCIGIKELKSYLEGDCTLDEAKELIKKNTRNYAKRQLTWFRKDKLVRWVKVNPEETSGEIAEKLLKLINS